MNKCFVSVKGGMEQARGTQGNANPLGKINLVKQGVDERILLKRSLEKQNASNGVEWTQMSIISSSESRC
jgi:hypothetical protein